MAITPRRRMDRHREEVVVAKNRVMSIIDEVPAEDLVSSIKRAPSLRGMILGYIAEEMFEKHVPEQYPIILSHHIEKHDDHDRNVNKSDRTIYYRGRRYGVQLKSIQTNSITWNLDRELLEADVQNDASDARRVALSDGTSIITTCYVRGEYDILAVPLFPFTGKWDYAYKRNVDCRTCTSAKYTQFQADHLLSTTERLSWPLDASWTADLLSILDDKIGSLASDFVAEPGGEIRVVEPDAVILPLKD